MQEKIYLSDMDSWNPSEDAPSVPVKVIDIDNATGGIFNFYCTGCGDCCRGGGNVYFSQEEMENVKEFLNLSEEKWSLMKDRLVQFKKNGLYVHSSSKACIFIDKENLCRIYPVRPLQCRSYPYWPTVFENKKELLRHRKTCPGFHQNTAPVTSLQIVRRVNATVKIFNEQQSHPEDPVIL